MWIQTIGDLDQRISTIEYVFTLGEGAIRWRSMLQMTIVLSKIEAKIYDNIECAMVEWFGGGIKHHTWHSGVALWQSKCNLFDKKLGVLCLN